MSHPKRKRARMGIAGAGACLALLLTAASAVEAQVYEAPANRLVRDVLPPQMIAGQHHRVRDVVVSYGYLHHYTVDSDFGVFQATGDGALRKLLVEIRAIAALKEVQRSEAFVEAVKHAVGGTVEFGKKLITDPVDTLSGLPAGVFTILGNVKTTITMEHDPAEDSRVKQALFVSSWKRDYCAKFGCDVYSSNKVLQEELNRVGWAAAIGGLVMSAATAGADTTAVTVASNMRLANSVKDALKEFPPSRLRIINEEKLAAMGMSEDLTKRYLGHQAFTPRNDTVMVEALSHLKGVRGRAAFLEFALQADGEVAANFFEDITETMSGYHNTVAPIQEITILSGFVLARTKNGSAVIPFPLDHGVWSQRADTLLNQVRATYSAPGFNGKYEIWVTGDVTPLARQQLRARGMEIVENIDARFRFID